MSSWTERMASVVAACGPRQPPSGLPYHRRLEKVKFGVPLDQVCKRDIPGPLLVMLLKLNKEGPFKKDVFRAPGHQGNMKKLSHFLQQGRLVNIHSFSVNTIASVIKKFLRKLPGGIFGPENEAELFRVIKSGSEEEKLTTVQRIFLSLPIYSQHLLVLLFGTFRVIHSNSERAKTGMTAGALGISVAPSFFHTCVSEGKIAKLEEVNKFKLATKITTFFIEHFGMRDLLGRENYEYYARLTGRILKVEDEWIFFTYPPVIFGGDSGQGGNGTSGPESSRAGEPVTESGLMVERSLSARRQRTRRDSDPETSERAAAVVSGAAGPSGPGPSGLAEKSGSLEIIPESCPLDPNGRLSISLDDHNVSSPSSCNSHPVMGGHVIMGGHGNTGGMHGQDRHHTRAHVHDFRAQTGVTGADKCNIAEVAVARGCETADIAAEMKSYTACLPQRNSFRRHSSACSTNWMGCIEKEVFEVSTGSDTEGCGGGGGVFFYDPLEEEPLTEHLELDHSLQHEHSIVYDPIAPSPIKHTRRILHRTVTTPVVAESNAVHQRQTERMRHRSEWFLSDPTGLVTVKCRPDRPSSLGPNQMPTPANPSPHQVSLPLPQPRRLSPSTTPRMTGGSAAKAAAAARLGRSPSSSPRFFSTPSAPVAVPTCSSPSLSSTPFQTANSSSAFCDISVSSFAALQSAESPLPTLPTPNLPSHHLPSHPPTAAMPPVTSPRGGGHQQSSAFLPPCNTATIESPLHLVTQSSTASIPPQPPPSNSNQSIHQLISQQSPCASGNGSNVRLRRRLSDKDKERRLVRRSSSKRKDKENGVGMSAAKISASSGSLDKGSSSGLTATAHTAASADASGPINSLNQAQSDSGPASIEHTSDNAGRAPAACKSRPAGIHRAGSADAGGSTAATAAQFRRQAATEMTGERGPSSSVNVACNDMTQHHAHAALCRTGSQDHPPHVEMPAVLARSGSGAGAASGSGAGQGGSASPLTRSLPRI